MFEGLKFFLGNVLKFYTDRARKVLLIALLTALVVIPYFCGFKPFEPLVSTFVGIWLGLLVIAVAEALGEHSVRKHTRKE